MKTLKYHKDAVEILAGDADAVIRHGKLPAVVLVLTVDPDHRHGTGGVQVAVGFAGEGIHLDRLKLGPIRELRFNWADQYPPLRGLELTGRSMPYGELGGWGIRRSSARHRSSMVAIVPPIPLITRYYGF